MAEKPQLAFVDFKVNTYIIVEGKLDIDRFFIIRQGKVRISKTAEIVSEGDILGPGDFFGIVSTMSVHAHIETVQALTDVSLIAVHKNQFEGLIEHNTPIAMKIILSFSRRMRYLDHALTRITLKGTDKGEDKSILWTIGQFYESKTLRPQAYYAYYQFVKLYPDDPLVERARARMNLLQKYAAKLRFDYDPEDVNRSYKKDSILFSEGEKGEELFIIKSGAVKITKIMNNNEVLLAVLKPGDIFGEMALLESEPRSASAIAHEDCTVMVINRDNFQSMAATQPQIVARLTKLLADRIWLIYKQLANALIEDPIERIYDALVMQLEKERIPLEMPSAHTFNFGAKELATMVGIPQQEMSLVLYKLLQENRSKSVEIDNNNKIHVSNVVEVAKECTYHRNIRLRKENRR
ncbi:Crp/Fnr family transcriptional regulator [Spirochaetia bacterium]|nr:Crp/Fnr family transcriptional regulator [Spirochaetia bacterium]